jgi:hypothetical protein
MHGETKHAYEILVGKFEMNRLLGKVVYVWWGQDLRLMKKGTLTQDRVQWRLPLRATVNSEVRNLLASRETFAFINTYFILYSWTRSFVICPLHQV